MAQAQRNDIDHGGDPLAWQQAAEAHRRYPAGGSASHLQADLARRLVLEGLLQQPASPPSPIDRAIRALSTSGGYVGLLMGYVAVTSAITYWLRS